MQEWCVFLAGANILLRWLEKVRLDGDTAGHDERTGIVGLTDEKTQVISPGQTFSAKGEIMVPTPPLLANVYRGLQVRPRAHGWSSFENTEVLDGNRILRQFRDKKLTDRNMVSAYERSDLIQGWVRRTVLPLRQPMESCLQVHPCGSGALVRPAGKSGTLGITPSPQSSFLYSDTDFAGHELRKRRRISGQG